jgi:hypothetical protein
MGVRRRGEGIAPVRSGRRFALSLGAVALALIAAPAARADFHLMSIREVYPGAANDSYVMLQMYSSGQTNLNGHQITLYGSTGSVLTTFTFAGGVANGENQRTVLVADDGYAAGFPSGPAPDRTHAALNLPAGGGAICFAGVDCVAWGNFSGTVSPSPGTPASAAGVTAGKALHRSIAAGCSTLLEATDDTDSSVADFSEQTPNPRSNASAIVETVCPSLPNTTIGNPKPANPTKSTTASFAFTATPSTGATFECKLDAEPGFTTCSSPTEYTELGEATHKFEVRAVNSAGADPSPAKHEWRVDLTPPAATILTQPADPSPGNSAGFTYSANETGSTFQCSLEPAGEPPVFSTCASSGKTYPDAQHPAPFADGEWTFEVRATDPAGNQGAADTFTWEVDNSQADETPPQTTIELAPPDPSTSASAPFTYSSNEAGSSFECALDGGAFTSCPASGIVYTALANGPHSFQVRATDGAGNPDPTPAGYSWQVAVPLPIAPVPSPVFSALAPPRPQTTITSKPGALTRDRTPSFRFRSSLAGSSFQCKVDRAPFRACRSPFTTKPLAPGPHVVRIRALVASLNDPTPAVARFKVIGS